MHTASSHLLRPVCLTSRRGPQTSPDADALENSLTRGALHATRPKLRTIQSTDGAAAAPTAVSATGVGVLCTAVLLLYCPPPFHHAGKTRAVDSKRGSAAQLEELEWEALTPYPVTPSLAHPRGTLKGSTIAKRRSPNPDSWDAAGAANPKQAKKQAELDAQAAAIVQELTRAPTAAEEVGALQRSRSVTGAGSTTLLLQSTSMLAHAIISSVYHLPTGLLPPPRSRPLSRSSGR